MPTTKMNAQHVTQKIKGFWILFGRRQALSILKVLFWISHFSLRYKTNRNKAKIFTKPFMDNWKKQMTLSPYLPITLVVGSSIVCHPGSQPFPVTKEFAANCHPCPGVLRMLVPVLKQSCVRMKERTL